MRRRVSLLVAIGAGLVAVLGALATAFLWRNPDVWVRADKAPPIFRVQSCSMEPSFRGPRVYWSCPKCRNYFPTSVDLDAIAPLVETDGTSGATSFAPDETSPSLPTELLAKTRFLTCPDCGWTEVPAQNPSFESGSTVLVERRGGDEPLDFRARLERAWKRETNRAYREREKRERALKPERWDVVVFRDALDRPTLKRIVGLPGELVTFAQGDVLIDGRVPTRSLKEALSTAVSIRGVEYRRSDERMDVVRVAKLRTGDKVSSEPIAISNESEIARLNGSNVAPVEPVRDFALSFGWFAGDGATTRFTALARRPTLAAALSFDESTRSVTLRIKTLRNGHADSGKKFEELSEGDFASEPGRRMEFPFQLPKSPRFTIATLDGELIFAVDGDEWARFELGDLDSTEIAPISEPFAILGAVARVGSPSLFRDLHYSSAAGSIGERAPDYRSETLTGRATKVPEGEYFALGDNSPVSLDSRFDSAGTVPEEKLLYIVQQ